MPYFIILCHKELKMNKYTVLVLYNSSLSDLSCRCSFILEYLVRSLKSREVSYRIPSDTCVIMCSSTVFKIVYLSKGYICETFLYVLRIKKKAPWRTWNVILKLEERFWSRQKNLMKMWGSRIYIFFHPSEPQNSEKSRCYTVVRRVETLILI